MGMHHRHDSHAAGDHAHSAGEERGAHAAHHHHGPHHTGHSHHGALHMGHSHHGAGGAASLDQLNTAFGVGIALNLAFVAAEAVFGFVGHSLSLLADAGHNLSDVFGLALAWVAAWISRRPPSPRRTYGLGRGTILASLGNAILLLIAVGAIAWEAVLRWSEHAAPDGGIMAAVAAVGIVINGGTAMMLLPGGRRDMNVRAAYLHMAADTAVSAGVVVAGLVVMWTGWWWVDSATSLAIALAIALSAGALLKE